MLSRFFLIEEVEFGHKNKYFFLILFRVNFF
jgi:hypothetical protein